MQRKLLKVILSKSFIFAILAVFQIGIMLALVVMFAGTGATAYAILTIISALILIGILEKDDLNPAYKVMWIVMIVVMPIGGVFFYLLFGQRRVPRSIHKRFLAADSRADKVMKASIDEDSLDALREESHRLYQSARYLCDFNNAPLYPMDKAVYYPIGRDFYGPFLDSLRGAKNYIFLQYYIWSHGEMLNSIVEILKEKAAEGVDVRIIYDGFGAMFNINPGFWKDLNACGVKNCAFSPVELTIHLSSYGMLNHRDHRKIAVIDGEIGFSGGLNIADEYVNLIERFGEWKDTSFKVTGECVYNMSVTFLRTWDFINSTETDFDAFKGDYDPQIREDMCLSLGYVQPYWDSPLDTENVAENAYLNIIRHATEYVYISTPYLILDHEMITNLSLAAKSGVDVRILTPGIPDKKMVFLVTRSYYATLIKNGVKIFEYTPGFNHAKMFVSDDREAIIGSANMDFRSLYLHFENGAAFYGGHMVHEVKKDMLECMAKSKEMTIEDSRERNPFRRIIQYVARFFGPLM